MMKSMASFRSASLIFSALLGAIGTGPKEPEPPLRTLSNRVASAPWPLYLVAISWKEGPTSFLSLAWQAMQPALVMLAVGSAIAGVATKALAARAESRASFFIGELLRVKRVKRNGFNKTGLARPRQAPISTHRAGCCRR